LLKLVETSKVYPGVRALDRVDLEFKAGEIHGLVGENGAGKSTVVGLVAGSITPDEGWLELEGQKDPYGSPAAAHAAHIAVVFQEFQSLPGVSVAENVLLGSKWSSGGIVSWRRTYQQAREALAAVELEIDVRRPMEQLDPAHRKLVEIARAIHLGARVVLLDEPTAALEREDSDHVLAALRRLRESGCAVVFVSHRLEEVIDVCDAVTVLRDGRKVGTWPAAEVDTGKLAELMVGRNIEDFAPPHKAPGTEPLLEVEDLHAPRIDGVSFTMNRGEILGLAGVTGSGRSELGRTLFGLERTESGRMTLHGETVALKRPTDAIEAGIAYVPADRQKEGLVFTLDILRNISLSILPRLARQKVINRGREREVSTDFFGRLLVKAPGLETMPETLSGGNQQKVLLARWLSTDPKLLILDEPTTGIDIGGKSEIHGLIAELAERGLGVILISSDLPELLAMSDRVMVLHRGEVVSTFARGEIDEAKLLLAASGGGEGSGGDGGGEVS
jgi:ABC-type sugar transport system ATPase subunit